jgi:hypothetical protein
MKMIKDTNEDLEPYSYTVSETIERWIFNDGKYHNLKIVINESNLKIYFDDLEMTLIEKINV